MRPHGGGGIKVLRATRATRPYAPLALRAEGMSGTCNVQGRVERVARVEHASRERLRQPKVLEFGSRNPKAVIPPMPFTFEPAKHPLSFRVVNRRSKVPFPIVYSLRGFSALGLGFNACGQLCCVTEGLAEEGQQLVQPLSHAPACWRFSTQA